MRPHRHISLSAPAAVLTRSQPGLNIPGLGDLSKLNVDLSDVPDGKYREVEVGTICM